MTEHETFDRALAIVEHRKTVRHEAAHAAAALILGLEVKGVRADFLTIEQMRTGDPEQSVGQVDVEGNDRRALLIATLAGPLAEGEPHWPPRFPPSLAPITPDEKDVGTLVAHLDLDAEQYAAVVDDARGVIASPAFKALRGSIADALVESPHRIGAAQLGHLHQLAQEAHMEHITFKAAIAPVTDEGVFEAVISTERVDREQDIVSATGMVKALSAWNRPIPLLWNHSAAPEDVVGTIDPASVHARNGEVIATGSVDLLDSARAREAWRSLKSRTAGFSFGYMITASTPRPNGGRIIANLDIFEISITPVPANNATRVLSTKTATGDDPTPHLTPEQTQDLADFRRDLAAALTADITQAREDEDAALREKAMRVVEANRPITLASFEC